MYFSLLKGNFIIALLNEELSLDLKIKLEEIYLPSIIIDESRDEIKFHSIKTINSLKSFLLIPNAPAPRTKTGRLA